MSDANGSESTRGAGISPTRPRPRPPPRGASESRENWEAYRAGKVCAHCGFSHPAVIDFHHVIRENKQSVNDLATKRSNVSAAIREAEEKCIPLCSNCHRILHWQERRRIRVGRKKKSRRKKA